MHIGIEKENIPLETAFKATKRYSDSKGFSPQQFKVKRKRERKRERERERERKTDRQTD